jgi:protein-tyrosine phosphatase
MADRNLDWDGVYNARDLGGLRAADGRATRWGALIRSDNLDSLTPAGWSALREHGIRTIVDLRNDDERQARSRPAGVAAVHVPLDDLADTEFWACWGRGLHATPLYYQAFLDRKPERCAAAVADVARAEPGGVLVHCVGGRDRTGLIALLLLALVGVAGEDIAADYELSLDRLGRLHAALGEDDPRQRINELLARQNTSIRASILASLDSLDAEAYLRDAGLTDQDLAAVRARLLGPPAARSGPA